MPQDENNREITTQKSNPNEREKPLIKYLRDCILTESFKPRAKKQLLLPQRNFTQFGSKDRNNKKLIRVPNRERFCRSRSEQKIRKGWIIIQPSK